MIINLRNSKWIISVFIIQITGIAFAIIPFMYFKQNSSSNPLGVFFTFAFGLFVVFTGLKALYSFLITFSFSENEIVINKWNFFQVKKTFFKAADIEKLEVSYSVMTKSKLHIYLRNQKRVEVDLNYVDQVEGDLVNAVLSQYCPGEPKTILTLNVAKTMSILMKIPFDTIYLEKSSVEE